MDELPLGKVETPDLGVGCSALTYFAVGLALIGAGTLGTIVLYFARPHRYDAPPRSDTGWWEAYPGGSGGAFEQPGWAPPTPIRPSTAARPGPSVLWWDSPCDGPQPCWRFSRLRDAEAYWRRCGFPPEMDPDGDGVVCDTYPFPDSGYAYP